jgi:hypothetical protein
VQRIGSVTAIGGGRRMLVAVDDVDLLAAWQLHAMTGVIASVGIHGLITNSSTSTRAAFSTLAVARRFA